jgi:hypothetical protein
MTKAETGMMYLQFREYQRLPANIRSLEKTRKSSSPDCFRETGSANSMTSDFLS